MELLACFLQPWSLMALTVENLKSVTASLWEVMEGRFLESTPLQRDVFDIGNIKFGTKILCLE